MEGFTSHQASRLTGCTPRQLRYWDQVGLVKPSVQGTGGRPGVPRLYSFRDLVALRVVRSLLDGGMSLQRVRRAWDFLNSKAKLDKQLSEVRLVTDGQSIFKISRKRDEILDALRHGQMAFFVAIDDIARGVSDNVAQFRADRERFIRALEDAKREVEDESVRMAAAGRGRPLHGTRRGATAGARAAFARPAPGLFHPPTR
jgi:DNA-binding transcriptional MerR regulator